MKARVDEARFRHLWRANVTVAEIAAALSISPNYVHNVARQLGLPHRGPFRGRRKKDVKAMASQVAEVSEILRTGGRYAELAAYADRHGCTLARAQQLWHRERVSA